MLVEALFWFHPLVWWIGARLVEERERACDEAVIQSGVAPQIYLTGISKVCRFQFYEDLAGVSAAGGANLKARFDHIHT